MNYNINIHKLDKDEYVMIYYFLQPKIINHISSLFLLFTLLFHSLLIHFIFLDWVKTVAFSPNGMYIATGSWDNTVVILDVKSRKVLKKLTNIHSGI